METSQLDWMKRTASDMMEEARRTGGVAEESSFRRGCTVKAVKLPHAGELILTFSVTQASISLIDSLEKWTQAQTSFTKVRFCKDKALQVEFSR